VAARGHGLFAYGTNSLVLTVANDAGALGLYVAGSVQLLCPLDEAAISMHPAQGPVFGGTTIEVRSNVQLYAARWIRCSFGDARVSGTVVDAYTVSCTSPGFTQSNSQNNNQNQNNENNAMLQATANMMNTRGWVDVSLVTSHQGHAAAGVHYQGACPPAPCHPRRTQLLPRVCIAP
jgi:hypothetical protein